MAWTKAKTTIAIGVAAILAVGTTTTLIANHYQKLASQIDYPRSLWRNAGYFSPVSAFETLFWATSQNDGKAVLMSLTPDLQQKMGQEAKHSGIAPEEYFSQSKNSSDHLNGIYGFRLIQSETISEDEVRLHLSLEGKPGEQTITMRKIGDEWKMDQDHLSPDRPQSASRTVPAKDRAVVGIGVKLDMEPGSRAVQITEVYPNSPAAGAGLTTGLIVQKIDGVPTIGKSLSNCVALIRGKAGTEVQLDLVNLKRNETNTVELVRQKFIPRRQ